MAANPSYADNIIAKTIYDQYIEGIGIKHIILPPYYTQTMLDEIMIAKNENMDIIAITVKEWYKRLLNRKILQFFNETDQVWERKITKIEYMHFKCTRAFLSIFYP